MFVETSKLPYDVQMAQLAFELVIPAPVMVVLVLHRQVVSLLRPPLFASVTSLQIKIYV